MEITFVQIYRVHSLTENNRIILSYSNLSITVQIYLARENYYRTNLTYMQKTIELSLRTLKREISEENYKENIS